MKFKLLLLADPSKAPRSPLAEIIFETDSDADVAKLRASCNALRTSKPLPPSRGGAVGRKVLVVGKAETCESPIQPGDTFDTANQASIALGYGYNAVAAALRTAETNNQTTVVVRGIEVQYADQADARD
jgi:hypothetical protein